MIRRSSRAISFPAATSGAIARINLKSARERSVHRFWEAPLRPGLAECLVEQEQLTAEFFGDVGALGRLEAVVHHLEFLDGDSPRSALLGAQVAAMGHRFTEARDQLGRAQSLGATSVTCERLALSVDQACGANLDAVLRVRKRLAASTGRLEDLVAFGSLLAELRYFDEADWTYRRAIQRYQDVSPFALAWACFQLGVLWGELVRKPDVAEAARWYRSALDYLPDYVKARVHLAELLTAEGKPAAATRELLCVESAPDPEVNWRLSEAESLMGHRSAAAKHLRAAHAAFELLLQKHLLAFADHAADFFSTTGGNQKLALELACANVANRPTLKAFEQAHGLALRLGESELGADLLRRALSRWAHTDAFRASSLARTGGSEGPPVGVENAALP